MTQESWQGTRQYPPPKCSGASPSPPPQRLPGLREGPGCTGSQVKAHPVCPKAHSQPAHPCTNAHPTSPASAHTVTRAHTRLPFNPRRLLPSLPGPLHTADTLVSVSSPAAGSHLNSHFLPRSVAFSISANRTPRAPQFSSPENSSGCRSRLSPVTSHLTHKDGRWLPPSKSAPGHLPPLLPRWPWRCPASSPHKEQN